MLSLVTGADGLLGSHVVRELLDRGHAVRALIQPGSQSPTLCGLDIERVPFNLPGEQEALNEHVRGCDFAFHLAAITNLWADPDLIHRVNVEGTERILEACRLAQVKRLVFCGSASSFGFGGTPETPGNEETPLPAVYRDVPYMVSKHRAMDLVLEAARKGEVDAVVCSPTFMLGLYDWGPSSGELIRQFASAKVSVVPPGGRNFVCASDVACGMVNALDRGKSGEVYIMGGENLSYRDFFTRVSREAGIDRRVRVLPERAVHAAGRLGSLAGHLTKRPMRFDAQTARLATLFAFYDPTKAREQLDMPATPVEAGIRRALRSLYDYGHLTPPDEGYFTGKVAVVTGGSRGVGLAVARELIRRGAKVTITARGAERLERSARELEELGARCVHETSAETENTLRGPAGRGGEVLAFAGDVADTDHAVEVIERTVERFGKLDILVNNAGISMRGSFEELTQEVCRRVLDTNTAGAVAMSRAAVSHIVETGGHLVFISSIAGLFGLPGASLYCASKAALTGFAESLRLELLGKGVHAGVVHLGFTEHDPEKRILAADGSGVLPDRPEHQTQLHAALEILDMMERRRRAVVLTAAGKLGKAAYRLSPGLVERAILTAQSGRWGVFKQFS